MVISSDLNIHKLSQEHKDLNIYFKDGYYLYNIWCEMQFSHNIKKIRFIFHWFRFNCYLLVIILAFSNRMER